MRPPPSRDEDFNGWAYWIRQNERRIHRSIADTLGKYKQHREVAMARYDPRGLVVSPEDYEYALSCVTPQIMNKIGPSIGDVEPGFCYMLPEIYLMYGEYEDSEEVYRRRYGWHSDELKTRFT